MLPISKLLCRNTKQLIVVPCQRYSDDEGGAIKKAGGKWAELQSAREGEYFKRKNYEFVEYIKEELKKGRSIEDIIEDSRKELKARQERRRKMRERGEDD